MEFLFSLLIYSVISGSYAEYALQTDKEVLERFQADNYLQQGDMFIKSPDGNVRMDWNVYPNWPENTIPYIVSENVTNELRMVIRISINYLHKYTCLRFRPARVMRDDFWVRFLMHPGLVDNPNSAMMCAAIVGFQGRKDQGVFLGPKCNPPSMVHELMHTIGLFHEHNRNDRDKFIKIHPKNMTEEAKGQYVMDKDSCRMQKFPDELCTMNDYGLNYNYDSLMHYCRSCGSINPNVDVYTVLNNKDALGKPENTGQAYGLSEGDWLLINRKYECDPAENPEINKPPPIPDNPPKFGRNLDLAKSSIKAKPCKH